MNDAVTLAEGGRTVGAILGGGIDEDRRCGTQIAGKVAPHDERAVDDGGRGTLVAETREPGRHGTLALRRHLQCAQLPVARGDLGPSSFVHAPAP